ncbi:NUDIX domain-containing protein [Streptomyces albus]|uniref:NUDIX domain-containing protein n=1 Tax=Streptomyces albus TaxID=1888 RepID=UPI00068DBE26|nr:NUDIX hydrolase [Streptomyces albus]
MPYVFCARGCRHWGPRAAGLLLYDRGRFLLQQRAPGVQHARTWSLPGGAMEPGETPRRAAHREAAEELGCLPRIEHVATLADEHGGWTFHTVIARTLEPFRPRPGNGEALAHRWCTPAELPTLPLHPGLAAAWPAILTALETEET